jgi:outer membrane protein assembly factor BamD
MKHHFYLIFLVLIASSCSTYSKISKADDYDAKFTLANQLFEKKRWTKSLNLYEQVYQRFPKTSQGEISYYRIGKIYYAMGDFYMAGYHFGSFFDKFPYSSNTEEAFFMKAICGVKNSPEQALDQQDTRYALNEIQQFIYLFPNSSRIDTCNLIMDNLRKKLEKKDYESIKLYAKTLNYRAAVVTSQTFLEEYPTSIHKEEVLFVKIKNSYLLTKNSVDEKKKLRIEQFTESYRNFVSQFPTSEYLKQLEVYKKEIEKEKLINLTNSK